jgi:hypothetical protein
MTTWVRVENRLLNVAEIVQVVPMTSTAGKKAKILYLSDGRRLNISEEDWVKIATAIGMPKEF